MRVAAPAKRGMRPQFQYHKTRQVQCGRVSVVGREVARSKNVRKNAGRALRG